MHPNEPQSAPVGSDTVNAASDDAKLVEYFVQLHANQSLAKGIVAGVVAALMGAVIWAVVTVMTEYQIGWMAVGVGFLVGFAVRTLGKGFSRSFGIVGAVCAFTGCALGNILSMCGFIAQEQATPIAEVVTSVLLQPDVALEILLATFSPMDLLFYGIAIYEGYRFSMLQIDDQKLMALTHASTPAPIDPA